MKKSIAHQFGSRVRELRTELNLTQQDLASRSKISLKYIQRIEGKTPPNIGIETLKKIIDGFEVTSKDLLGW